MFPPTYIEGFHDPDKCKSMIYEKLGNTDMEVSRIGIGGCSAGGEYGSVTEQQSIDTIIDAVKSGINYIDTSPGYGDGKSEIVIGKALRQLPRKSFFIATKVGRFGDDWAEMFDFSAKRTEQSVNTSLERLGVSCIDLIQVHDLEFADNLDIIIEETLPTLQKMVQQGKARHIGITGYPVSLLLQVLQRSTVTVHTVLSYCRNTLVNQDLRDHIPFLQSRGVGVINASLTSMALLTPGSMPDWHPANQDIKDAATQARALCQSRGVNIARLAVKYCLETPGVGVHVLGCDNQDVLRKNIDTFLTSLTDAELATQQEVVKLFAALPQTHWEGVEIAHRKEEMEKLAAKSAS